MISLQLGEAEGEGLARCYDFLAMLGGGCVTAASTDFSAERLARVGKTYSLSLVGAASVNVCPDLEQKDYRNCPKGAEGSVVVEGVEKGLGDFAYRIRMGNGNTGYMRTYQAQHFEALEVAIARNAKAAECARRGQPTIGMTKSQVAATCLGGQHHRVSRTVTASGSREQHVYPYSSRTAEAVYLYFDNGILSSIQD